MKDNKKSENQTYYMPIGMCLGISIGTAIGVATDNLSIYMPIGLSIGMCIGALIDAKNRKKAKSYSRSEMEETELEAASKYFTDTNCPFPLEGDGHSY